MPVLNPKEIARLLIEAEQNAKPLPPTMKQHFTLEEAYAVQLEVCRQKLEKGYQVVGKKIGLVSRAMQKMMNVDQPDYGHIFAQQMHSQGTPIDTAKFITPRVEGEIAFILDKDLTGPGVKASDVVRATRGVMACLEFVDSRWEEFDVYDSISDNASCGGFLLGSKLVPLENLDLRYIGMFIEKNGELHSSGLGVEIMGDPLNSVAWLANKLSEFGISLKAGEVVLSGAITSMVPVTKGDILQVSFSTLGSITVRFA